jgi:WD40 repeat protein
MAHIGLAALVRHLHCPHNAAEEKGDGDLLRLCAANGDEAAFAARVRRHASFVAKLKTMAVLVVLLNLLAAGAAWAAHRMLADRPAQPKAESAPPVRKDYYGDPLPPGVVARIGSVRLRHLRAHVAFAADGKTLISAGPDRRVCFWDAATGRPIRDKSVRGLMPDGYLYFEDAVLSGDGKTLAIKDGRTVYLHETAKGEERGRISSGIRTGKFFSLSADGKTLALLPVVSSRDDLHLWDASTCKERCILSHKSAIGAFVFSADGKLLASSANGLLHIWDTATGTELRSFRGGARGLAFSPDGKLLAAIQNTGTVTLWETANGNPQATLKPSPGIRVRLHPSQPPGLAFSPDGALLAVAGKETLVLWDVAERKERRRLPDRDARNIAFAADGKTLASVGEIEIRLWDVTTGRQLQQRPGHDTHLASIVLSPNGKILASVDWNRSPRLWDAATGKPLDGLPTGQFRGVTSAFSPDGKWLIGAGDGAVQFWDASTGKEGRRFAIEDLRGGKGKHELWEVALSSDGRRLTALSLGDRGLLQLSVWDMGTGQSMARRPHRNRTLPHSSVLTPDGAAVIVQNVEPGADPRIDEAGSSEGGLTLEDTVTSQRLLTIPRKLGNPIAFSPDGKLLAAGIHRSSSTERGYQVKSISVTEAATGQEVLCIEGSISPLAFSPDGRLLATIDAVGDGGLRIWDVATGQQLFRRAWPDDAVHHPGWSPADSLAFYPDGRRLATGMCDGTVLVWDLAPETWPKTDVVQHPDRKQLDAAWADLAGEGRKGHRAIYTLAASPKQALPFLAEHVRPAPAVDTMKVAKLLADLDSEQFAVREQAAKELTGMGSQIEPALQRILESKPSLEVRQRIHAIQESLRGVPPAATLRTLRAIRVLEAIGTAEARQLLRNLAGGAAVARETREATASLARLDRRVSAR